MRSVYTKHWICTQVTTNTKNLDIIIIYFDKVKENYLDFLKCNYLYPFLNCISEACHRVFKD